MSRFLLPSQSPDLERGREGSCLTEDDSAKARNLRLAGEPRGMKKLDRQPAGGGGLRVCRMRDELLAAPKATRAGSPFAVSKIPIPRRCPGSLAVSSLGVPRRSP